MNGSLRHTELKLSLDLRMSLGTHYPIHKKGCRIAPTADSRSHYEIISTVAKTGYSREDSTFFSS